MPVVRRDLLRWSMAWPWCPIITVLVCYEQTKSWKLRACNFLVHASGSVSRSVLLKAWKVPGEPPSPVSGGSLKKQASVSVKAFSSRIDELANRGRGKQRKEKPVLGPPGVGFQGESADHVLRWAFPLQITKRKPVSCSVLSAQCSAVKFFLVLVGDNQDWHHSVF